MRLLVVHYHFRPGGVRRVVELGLPHLVRAAPPKIGEVWLIAGEQPAAGWLRLLRRSLGRVAVRVAVEPAFGYASAGSGTGSQLARQCAAVLRRLLGGAAGSPALVWAHNLGLGRNLPFARALGAACAAHGARLLAHHHDWWFDNRWQRWAEMRQAGFRTLRQVAAGVLGAQDATHIAINRTDLAVLQRHFGRRAAWFPNPADTPRPLPLEAAQRARRWLSSRLSEDAPVWLVPTRLLRRKNLAEAVLLARWLRPEAWVVTTGGISSADESAYAERLRTAAQNHGWRLRLGVLAAAGAAGPTVAELLAASEAVLFTSIQEGFGLPYLEAAGAGRPLVARVLPNIGPDLARFGFRFPQAYRGLRIAPALFDWDGEVQRQRRLLISWRRRLPLPCRAWAGRPALLERPGTPNPVDFSRLTLTAQLEVLAQPVAASFAACAALNPFLDDWRSKASQGLLRPTPWPEGAADWLGGAAYARRFWRIARLRAAGAEPHAATAAHEDFMRQRLAAPNLFPLLWSSET